MKNKEFQRRLVYDTLILLGVFTVILFMCRLWPLILLCILGLFAAMIRLLFLSRKETVIIQSVPQEPAKAETEKDLQQLAFELAIRRITERVTDDFPQARWVWKSQHAKEDILSGRDTAILLNQAGGYREAIVHIQNLQVAGITYGTSPEPEQEAPEVPEPDEEPVSNPDSHAAEAEPVASAPRVDYELLACEWVELHVIPGYYELQLRFYMSFDPVTYGAFSCLWGNNPATDLAIPEIERDIVKEDIIFEKLDRWIWSLEHDKPPKMDEVAKPKLALEALAKIYGASQAGLPTIEFPAKFEHPLRRIALLQGKVAECKAEIDTYEKEIEAHSVRIAEIMKEHEHGILNTTTDKLLIDFITRTTRRPDSAKLKEKYPAAYADVLKTTQSRKVKVRVEPV